MHRLVVSVLLIAIGALLLAGCGSSSEAAVTGTVSFQEPAPLRPDTVVMVLIRDVSKIDTHATVIVDQYMSVGDKRAPFAYEVPYSADKIDESHSYSVFARVQDSAGKLLYVSNTLNPVSTQGNPTTAFEIVVVPVGD